MKKLIPILVVLGLGAGGVFLVKSMGGGGGAADTQALALVAENTPQSAVGVAAVAGPGVLLSALGDRLDDDTRATILEEAEFDVFDPANYNDFGLDLTAPAGFAILEADPLVVAVTLGMHGSPAEARDAMQARLQQMDPPEGALQPTEVGSTPGLFVEEEFVVLFDETRVAFVVAELPWDTEDAQGALAEYATSYLADEGEDFASANDIAAAANFRGNPLMTAVLNPVTVAELIGEIGPAPGWDEVTAIGFAVEADNDRLLVQTRSVVLPDSQFLSIVGGAGNWGDATSMVPGPVEFGVRIHLNLDAALTMMQAELEEMNAGTEYDDALAGANEATGLDMQEDVINNLTGEIGLFLQTIPNEATINEARAVFFMGVKDTEAAANVIVELVETAGGMAEVREIGDTNMYVVPVGPTIGFAAYDGYIWVTADADALAAIIGGDSTGFSAGSDYPAAAELFGNDHVGASFVDFSGQFGELVLENVEEDDAPGASEFLQAIRSFSYEADVDGNVMTADAVLNWDGDAAANAFMIAVQSGINDGGSGQEQIIEVPAQAPEVVPAQPVAGGGKPDEEAAPAAGGKP